ncbi:MAG: hypothetical protein AAF460_09305 [Pseudomonadota bacterium]
MRGSHGSAKRFELDAASRLDGVDSAKTIGQGTDTIAPGMQSERAPAGGNTKTSTKKHAVPRMDRIP